MKHPMMTVFWSLAIATVSNAGENWTSYRGPTDQGHADAARLPLRWSEEENVVWKTPIPGKAWSSPVIWGDRIWLTDANEAGTLLYAVCVDKASGKVVLRKRFMVDNDGVAACVEAKTASRPSSRRRRNSKCWLSTSWTTASWRRRLCRATRCTCAHARTCIASRSSPKRP